MPDTIKVIILGVDEDGIHTVQMSQIEDKLEVLQGIVGGYIEQVYADKVHEDGTHIYINEEGKLEELMPNALATMLCREHGYLGNDWIAGTAIVLGDGGEGAEGDVPDWAVAYIEGKLNEQEG